MQKRAYHPPHFQNDESRSEFSSSRARAFRLLLRVFFRLFPSVDAEERGGGCGGNADGSPGNGHAEEQ